MSNKFGWDEEESQEFSDRLDGVEVAPPEIPKVSKKQATKKQDSTKAVQKQQPLQRPAVKPEPVYQEEIDEDEEDFQSVLSDARLRLEQGRLYEMIMNHDLFEGVDADPRAIKHVQKEIRKFAKESMEIMLGMRQTKSTHAVSMESEGAAFNGVEIQALKDLAFMATKGASSTVEEKRTGLNRINTPTKQLVPSRPLSSSPQTPIKRKTNAKQEAIIEQILAEEGITREEYDAVYGDYRPLDKPLDKMSVDEKIERNKRTTAGRQVRSNLAKPMPDPSVVENMYTAQANQAAANPQMNMIMTLLNNNQKK